MADAIGQGCYRSGVPGNAAPAVGAFGTQALNQHVDVRIDRVQRDASGSEWDSQLASAAAEIHHMGPFVEIKPFDEKIDHLGRIA